MRPPRARLFWALVAVSLAVLVAVAFAFDGLGRWLMWADALAPAAAIAVLNGGPPLLRAVEAARLYHEGWASEVWLVQITLEPGQAALARQGVVVDGGTTANRSTLLGLGVPARALRTLPAGTVNTASEILLIARELDDRPGGRVIIVTSKPHSRRVRVLWNTLIRDPGRAVVRYTRDDPYDPAGWWRRRREAREIRHELLGLVQVWLRLPLKTGAE